jgi:hypothetical protein
VIYVSPDQLEQVEYLIQQSSQGNHLLFDRATLKRVFSPDSRSKRPLAESEAYAVEHHLERIIVQPSLGEMRAYVETLDPETLDQVVRTYFNIVENNLYETLEVRH